MKAHLDKNTYAFIHYSYTDPRDEVTGKRLPDAVSHRANIGIKSMLRSCNIAMAM